MTSNLEPCPPGVLQMVLGQLRSAPASITPAGVADAAQGINGGDMQIWNFIVSVHQNADKQKYSFIWTITDLASHFAPPAVV